ncbi:FadR/GntR family transcriptional regulator [Bacillus cereus]
MQKPKRTSLVDQVVEQVQFYIESHTWPIGTKLPSEQELVEKLGVSRNTIREAMKALVHIGLLEVKQGDGTYVRNSTGFNISFQRRLKKEKIEEILEVRYALEMQATKLAVMKRTDKDIQLLQECLRKRNLARKEGKDIALFIQKDAEFHMAVVGASHNQILVDLYKSILESIRESIGGLMGNISQPNTQKDVSHDIYVHYDIVKAIITQDMNRAEKAVHRHLQMNTTTLQI